MLSFSDNNLTGVNEALNSASSYLDGLLNIDIIVLTNGQLYPTELRFPHHLPIVHIFCSSLL